MHIILETERFLLRRFTLEDAPLLLELNSDPEVLQYLHEPPLQNIADAERVLKDIIFPQYDLYNLGRWAVIEKATENFTGWSGLKYRPEIDEIDLGYRFMKKYWGKGFASETARAVLDYGFDALKLKAITGRAHIENTASLTVLQKIGMQYIKDEVVDECPVKTFIKTIN